MRTARRWLTASRRGCGWCRPSSTGSTSSTAGYGAKLEYPEPDPPAEPDKPWRWTVTPKWRRSEGGPFSAFNVKGNTAQMDEKAVKLVCAAALAGGSDRPLLLILDELGRNLGSQHRREAVALFEQIGRDRNITVIGALQDDMERYALSSSRLYVKLRRSSDTMAYNQAPVVKGNEEYSARVELLRNWLDSYRGTRPTLDLATPTLDSADGMLPSEGSSGGALADVSRSTVSEVADEAGSAAGGADDAAPKAAKSGGRRKSAKAVKRGEVEAAELSDASGTAVDEATGAAG